jgi:hypothetical protein
MPTGMPTCQEMYLWLISYVVHLLQIRHILPPSIRLQTHCLSLHESLSSDFNLCPASPGLRAFECSHHGVFMFIFDYTIYVVSDFLIAGVL